MTSLCGAVYEDLVANSWMRNEQNNCKDCDHILGDHAKRAPPGKVYILCHCFLRNASSLYNLVIM